jgi:hypothetical protein
MVNEDMSSSAVFIKEIVEQNMPYSRRTKTGEPCDGSGKE